MTKLTELDLSFNKLNSSIPLWLVHSKSHLDLKRNEFDNIEGGLFEMMNNACSLKSLHLSYNSFRSEIFGSNKNLSACLSYGLESLYLSNIEATGRIPDWIGELKNLKELDLGSNSFSGPIPSSITKLSLLRTLDLSRNQFSGSIPQFIGNLSSLTDLSLSDNQLNGSVPHSLGRLPILTELDLSNNQLDGIFPEIFARPSFLNILRISNNRFTGIPNDILKLSNLEELDISYNPFDTVISTNLSSLTELVNMSNWFPRSIYSVNMSSCGIGYEILQVLQKDSEIGILDLSNNTISDVYFHTRFNTTSLSYLDLSLNSMNGNSLTEILEAIPQIEILLLGTNHINGSLSNSLCMLKNLQVIDLSQNDLTGEIPNCWKKLQQLLVIDLSSNKLSGKIPKSIGQVSNLKRLHLNNNTLEGQIPSALRSCTQLELLDLGDNRLLGSVPTWIGLNHFSLRILRLRKNKLTGIIPQEVCQLDNLKILDLAQNDLIGEIPRCLGQISGMKYVKEIFSPISFAASPASAPISENFVTYDDESGQREKVSLNTKGLDLVYSKMQLKLMDLMDLSSNKLVGVIPEELCLLTGLRSLNLSHNQITGNIPNKIGDLQLLDTLDLSNNQLFGAIPHSISYLLSMAHLNLSNNNLSGKIPTGNQLQTLDDPSIYSGNIQLCGDPLPKCSNESIQHPNSSSLENREHEDDKKDKIWFWFIVTIGYATGFWAVIGTLVLKKNWRIAYFRFVDNTKEQMLVMISVNVAKLKKKIKSSEE